MHIEALSFGQAASQYDAIRPSYPAVAVVWALGAAPVRVVDLGAGTGILTRVLLAAGHDVVPVEPDELMRARLTAATPDGPVPLAGSAEAIPLPDGSVDGVMAGQAYHWFDRERAHPEIARVLRPGGVFAPIWNIRDESVPWVAQLSEAASLGDGSRAARCLVGDLGPEFGPADRAEFRHVTTHTADSLVALVRSRSYYLTSSPADRAAMDARIRKLTGTHPDLAGRKSFPLPYLTTVYRAYRRRPAQELRS